MGLVLNQQQSEGLADFYFDLAKGFVLGGIGFATASRPEARLMALILSLGLAYICVRFGLSLLEEVRDDNPS